MVVLGTASARLNILNFNFPYVLNLSYRPPTPNIKSFGLHDIRSLNRENINNIGLLVSNEGMF